MGRIDDQELAAGFDVIHWHNLENLAGYRPNLAKVAELWREHRPAALIVRACSPIVAHKLRRQNCAEVFKEPRIWQGKAIQAGRWIGGPDQVAAWIKKFTHERQPTI